MNNLSTQLSILIKEAFENQYPDYKNKECSNNIHFRVNYVNSHGTDYIFSGLTQFSKLTDDSIKVIGEKIINYIKDYCGSKFNLYINKNNLCINVSDSLLEDYTMQIINSQKLLTLANKKNILVDFSSPNIAKHMHVGHLRSTIIGDSICRLFEEQGHNVLRINHIGDFGLQFGMLIQYLLENKCDDINLSDLQSFYRESKKLFDNDIIFKNNAYKRTVELQQGNNDILKIWNIIKSVSYDSYNDIYKRLDIVLDPIGESYYQQMIPKLISELKNKNLLEECEGRLVLNVPDIKVPLTVVKSDGGYTYDTTDLAALRYRLIDLNVDEIYYVVDIGQSLHFNLLFGAAKLAGWLDNKSGGTKKLMHVGFGLVCKEDGTKFKTRSGNTINLVDLLDEGILRSKKMLNKLNNGAGNYDTSKKKERIESLSDENINNIIESVAYSSIKYADLSGRRTNNYKFSFEKMLALKGNTAPYLLYVYVRITSILEKYSNYIKNKENINVSNIKNLVITDNSERNICKELLQFPNVLDKVNNNLMLHHICKYVYNLSTAFHKFFESCRCLYYDEKKENIIKVDHNRLLICKATRKVMKVCFNILGIKPLNKM